MRQNSTSGQKSWMSGQKRYLSQKTLFVTKNAHPNEWMGKQHGTIMVVQQGEGQEPRGEERRDRSAVVVTKAVGEEDVLEVELFVVTDSQ
jgi:hypothetical protein